MDVWVLEWSCRDDGDTKVTVWSNEIDAQKQAVKEISGYINSYFDFDNSDDESCAEDFNDMVARKHYDEAINRFNDHQDNYNSDYAQLWYVSKKSVLSGTGQAAAGLGVSMNATSTHSNGATCRGPCKQHNPYANADKSDGTYVCRQCSTFKSIFGTP
jgi:hypothetical protein